MRTQITPEDAEDMLERIRQRMVALGIEDADDAAEAEERIRRQITRIKEERG